MKIALLTVHVGSNFGSVLQTVATSKILKEMGNTVDVINYVPSRTTVTGYVTRRAGLSGKIKAVLNLPIMWRHKRNYGGFIKRYASLTREYFNKESLASLHTYDLYMVGSDQVWNSVHNEGLDTTYYLDFNSPGKHIAFSSSFGREELPEEEYGRVKELLKSFSAISVREKSAVELLHGMGYEEAIQTVDPTFLLDRSQWLTMASPRLIKEPYLLVYVPYNVADKELIYGAAREIAAKRNLKLITFGWDVRKEPLADRTMLFSSPADFLSLMEHADVVITNSFHGTAFSVILNKQFVVFSPSHFSTRIRSVLELTGLENRHVTNNSEVGQRMSQPIDYTPINHIITQEREKAIHYLKEALSPAKP